MRDAAARKALRRIERLVKAAARGKELTTEWESEFLVDVRERINKHGRAFADPAKGSLDFAVSIKQSIKLAEIKRSMKRRTDKNAKR